MTRWGLRAATLSDAALDRHARPGLIVHSFVIAHILTVSVIRRQTIVEVLRELGVADVEARDPIECERMLAARA